MTRSLTTDQPGAGSRTIPVLPGFLTGADRRVLISSNSIWKPAGCLQIQRSVYSDSSALKLKGISVIYLHNLFCTAIV